MKQDHLKRYYCDEHFQKTKENLWQSMLWFEEDLHEFPCADTIERNHAISSKIKNFWQEMVRNFNPL